MDVAGIELDPQQLLEVGGAAGGLIVATIFGFLLVKRARARRLVAFEDQSKENVAAKPEAEALPAEEEPAAALPESPGATPLTEVEASWRGPLPARTPVPKPPPYERKPNKEAREAKAPGTDKAQAPTVEAPRPTVIAETPAVRAPVEKPRPPEPAVSTKKDTSALRSGLAKTRGGWISRLGQLFAGKKTIDPSILTEIEKVLFSADIGVRTTQKLLDEMRGALSRQDLKDTDAIWAFLKERTAQLLSIEAPPLTFEAHHPFVILVIGVNGSGKTTTIGKLAARLKGEGKKVLLGAGDTFRAAATEQLQVWANRASADLVRGKEGADPSSVLFDAVKKGATEGYDVVLADTAGRLHTKTDLMEELQKVRRVIGKAAPGCPHETWLVIDSTSGQNAIAQAEMFTKAMSVSGIVLTKLDGTAKGGVILGISDQLQIPVRLIGVGERVEDLRDFDSADFVEALFEENAS